MTLSQVVASPLEAALLAQFHALYAEEGFPDPIDIAVVGRKNTGAGRYVELQTSALGRMRDGGLDLSGRYIAMEGLPHGMMAVVHITGGRPTGIEIAVYGEVPWDGVERQWSIV